MIISLLPFLKVHLQTPCTNAFCSAVHRTLSGKSLREVSSLGQDCPALIPDCLPGEGGCMFRLQGPPGCRHICFFVGLFQLSAFYQQSSCDKLVRSPFSLVSPHARVVQFSAGMVSCQSALRFILVIECIAFRPASTCSPALTPAVQWNTRHKCVPSL